MRKTCDQMGSEREDCSLLKDHDQMISATVQKACYALKHLNFSTLTEVYPSTEGNGLFLPRSGRIPEVFNVTEKRFYKIQRRRHKGILSAQMTDHL